MLFSLFGSHHRSQQRLWMKEWRFPAPQSSQTSIHPLLFRETLTAFCNRTRILKKQWSYSEVLQKQFITPKLNFNLKAVSVYISTLCFTHESFHLLLKIAKTEHFCLLPHKNKIPWDIKAMKNTCTGESGTASVVKLFKYFVYRIMYSGESFLVLLFCLSVESNYWQINECNFHILANI